MKLLYSLLFSFSVLFASPANIEKESIRSYTDVFSAVGTSCSAYASGLSGYYFTTEDNSSNTYCKAPYMDDAYIWSHGRIKGDVYQGSGVEKIKKITSCRKYDYQGKTHISGAYNLVSTATCFFDRPCLPPVGMLVFKTYKFNEMPKCLSDVESLISGDSFDSGDALCYQCGDKDPITFYYKQLDCTNMTPDSYYDSDAMACLPYPTSCPENEYLLNRFCACVPGFDKIGDTCVDPDSSPDGDSDGDGTLNKNDSDSSLYVDPNGDDDGDGILNKNDPDSIGYNSNDPESDLDGDTILNKNDPDSNSYNPNNPDLVFSFDCDNTVNTDVYMAFSYETYHYYGLLDAAKCTSLANGQVDIDDYLNLKDTNPDCTNNYCYFHKSVQNCNFNPVDYIPANGYVYKAGLSESQCAAAVDGINFLQFSYEYPAATLCPNTSFCFLLASDSSTSHSDINNTTLPDLNSTSSDFAPLLQSQNTTNDNLKKINDKIIVSNKSLENINSDTSKLLINNKSMKSSLDSIDLTAIDSLTVQNKSLTKLDTLQRNSDKLKTQVNDLKNVATSIDNKMNTMSNNVAVSTEAIEGGLFGDDPFADFDFTDGSDTFSTLGTEASDSFSSTTEYDIFGLASASSNSLPSYTASFHGSTIVIFEPSMLNDFPLTEMRSLIMFLFAVMGFVHTFRSV